MPKTSGVIIIGSGPAAWTAAIYTARALLKPLVIAGEQSGGQLMLTTNVENYPGFEHGILGPELMTAMRKQVEKLGVEIIDQNATSLSQDRSGLWVVKLNSSPPSRLNPQLITQNAQPSASSRSAILATGATANTLRIPGEDRLLGRGVGTCAVCDAPLFKGRKQVFIVGGGDSAVEEASELAKFAQRVVMLVRRDQLRSSPILQQRLTRLQNIEIWYNTEAIELIGDQALAQVKVRREGKEQVHPADGLFYAIGHTPATKFLAGSGVELDAEGYILTPLSTVISHTAQTKASQIQKTLKTRKAGVSRPEADGPLAQDIPLSDSPTVRHSDIPSIPNSANTIFPTMTTLKGVFAAGDCVDSRYRQAITATGFGCMAAMDCQKWLELQP